MLCRWLLVCGLARHTIKSFVHKKFKASVNRSDRNVCAAPHRIAKCERNGLFFRRRRPTNTHTDTTWKLKQKNWKTARPSRDRNNRIENMDDTPLGHYDLVLISCFFFFACSASCCMFCVLSVLVQALIVLTTPEIHEIREYEPWCTGGILFCLF